MDDLFFEATLLATCLGILLGSLAWLLLFSKPTVMEASPVGTTWERVEQWWDEIDEVGSGDGGPRGTRAKRHLETMAKRGGQRGTFITFLESSVVSVTTKMGYLKAIAHFLLYCSVMGLSLSAPGLVDHSLIQYCEMAFEAGEDVSFGRTVMAAWSDAFPEYGKNGPYFNMLPRVRRGLAGWAKFDPPSSRVPLGWTITAGITVVVRVLFGLPPAMMIAVIFDVYLRPHEAIGALLCDVTLPLAGLITAALTICPRWRGRATKVGDFDDTVLIGEGIGDSPSRRGDILRIFIQFVEGRRKVLGPNASLFGVSYATLLRCWKVAGAALGIPADEAVPYASRHGGASQDAADGLDDRGVQRRGRWSHPKSVRRYKKKGRLQQGLGRLSPAQLAFCRYCEAHWADIMMEPTRAPPLPSGLPITSLL